MAKKKKVDRGYATTSMAKKEPKVPKATTEVLELEESVKVPENASLPITPDAIAQQLETQVTNEKDADRLLKWQVDYEFKSQDQKRIKLESNETLPELQVAVDENEILELLKSLEEDAQTVSEEEMNKTFLMMEKLGYDRHVIKKSLENSCGDLIDAISWAVLNNQSNDVKPISKEIDKGITGCKVTESNVPIDIKDDAFKLGPKSIESESVKLERHSLEAKKGGIDKDLQRRVLASLQWLESDEEELQEKNNFIEEYASMYIKHLELKETASEAKLKGDAVVKKSASNSAHKLMQKIIQLKCKMSQDQLKSSVEIIDDWISKHDKSKPDEIDNNKLDASDSLSGDDLGLNIFDELDINSSNNASKTIYIHDLSWKGWSGSSPSFWLSDFIRRKYPTGKISYSLLQNTPAYRAKLRLELNDEDIQEYLMEEDELARNKTNAKDYIALKALYTLSPDAQIKNSVAPPFRDLWDKWTEETVKSLQEQNTALDKERIDFIQDLKKDKSKNKLQSVTANEANIKPTSKVSKQKLFNRVNSITSRINSALYQKNMAGRTSLPIYSSKQKIIDEICAKQVVIISGETGSGKSTQIPQFILENAIEQSDKNFQQIFCCQPRRISAISLANRVSVECGDADNQLGKPGSWVGYQVRMDNKTCGTTLLTFCTLGILLRRLVGDPLLSDISHVIVDEVHERSVESDFLLLLLKRLLLLRRDLKLILMSATADIYKYQEYFRQNSEPACLQIPGKIYPVKEFFLEDIIEQIGWEPETLESRDNSERVTQKVNISGKGGKKLTINAQWSIDDLGPQEFISEDVSKQNDLQIRNRKIDMDFMESLIAYVVKYSLEHSMGAILVFLPGVAEISTLQDRLELLSTGRLQLPCVTFPLYSDLPNVEQLKVFDSVEEGFVKVVLSTNIAETGLTVPDVTFVIDTAKARELTYDPSLNLTALREIVVSKSNCLQRRGRAGRTQSGIYYNILTRSAFESLPDHRPPELMRLPLEGICLKARAILGKGAGPLKDLFSESLDPPPPKNIEKAVNLLQQLKAMTESETLTPLGVHLSKLGMDAKLGKMLIYSTVFKCLDPILTISAILSTGRSIFLPSFGNSMDYKRSLKKFFTSESDILMIHNAYIKWKDFKTQNPSRAVIKAFCRENYLNISVLTSLDAAKSQILRSVLDTGIIDRKEKIVFGKSVYDVNSSSSNVTKAILSVAFFPNISHSQKLSDRSALYLYRLGDCRPVNVHPNSLLGDKLEPNAWYGSNSMKVSNGKIVALDLNLISPLGVLCLASSDIEINIIQRSLSVFNGSITIKASPKALIIVSKVSNLIQKVIDFSLQPQFRCKEFKKVELEKTIQKFISILS